MAVNIQKGFDEVNIRLAMVVPMITNESNNVSVYSQIPKFYREKERADLSMDVHVLG